MSLQEFPSDQLTEAQQLTADALVDLFQITFTVSGTTNVTYFTPGPTCTWQGNTFQSMACKLSGKQKSTQGQQTRPQMVVLNPAGIFTAPALSGYFEGAMLIQYKVLYQDILANSALYTKYIWRISRVFGIMSGQSISFELRTISDGPQFNIPARKYMPDAGFPFVTL
jgi:hypothetical protein